MRLTTTVPWAALLALTCQAALASDSKTTLTVYMINESIAPPALANMAKALAGKILSAAGISIDWHTGQPKGPLGTDTLIIEMGANPQGPVTWRAGLCDSLRSHPHNGVLRSGGISGSREHGPGTAGSRPGARNRTRLAEYQASFRGRHHESPLGRQ